MWGREVGGLRLTFHLAGINNQNFIMRDEETGTFWQQISGAAISGPLAGRHLNLISADELTLGLWKAEQPNGTVVRDVSGFAARYAKKDWDVRMEKTPTVIDYPQPGMTGRTIVLGIRAFGEARAWPYEAVLEQKLVQDRLGAEPILIMIGADGQSVRAFHAILPDSAQRIDKAPADFYRLTDNGAVMMDSASGSRWDFRGCAIDGRSKGTCLDRIDLIKDYWFDWRHYNRDTSVSRQFR